MLVQCEFLESDNCATFPLDTGEDVAGNIFPDSVTIVNDRPISVWRIHGSDPLTRNQLPFASMKVRPLSLSLFIF